jgi:TRAP-type mannitol/chloroaromatic compound transport system permease small subunit
VQAQSVATSNLRSADPARRRAAINAYIGGSIAMLAILYTITKGAGLAIVIPGLFTFVVPTLVFAAIGLILLGMLIFSPFGLTFARIVDAVTTVIGKWVAWLVLVAVVISAVNAIIRKTFDTSSNSWLELQWVLFGCVFLLCAPWTLLSNEHIRIDIVNNRLSRRVREEIEVIGHLIFLLPLTVVMMITSWPFFFASYRIGELSLNAGGLPQWPSKFLVPLGFTVLFFQALSELSKRVAMNQGIVPDTLLDSGGHHAAAEAEAERLKAIATEEAARRSGAQA